MQDQSSELCLCPSFNSYSSDKLADIAANVSREFDKLDLEASADAPPPYSSGTASQIFHRGVGGENDNDNHERDGNDNDEDDDFEFVSLSTAGQEVFLNGGPIGPVFPVFNRDLLLANSGDRRENRGRADDEIPGLPSSSSSEADELEGVPAGTYCVWTPKGVPPSPGRCKKSKSTGSSSRRWSFRELLRRCNSDGKAESFVFLTPSASSKKTAAVAEEKVDQKTSTSITAGNYKGSSSSSVNGGDHAAKLAGKGKMTTAAAAAAKGGGNERMAAAHKVFYVRNRNLNQKGAEKRKSFLPYRQDLVGFFANVNTMSRTFPPF